MHPIRSLLFSLWLYLTIFVCAVGLSPALLMPHGFAMGVIKFWARMVLFGLRWIAGIKVEIRGLEYRPTGGTLVAAKHQSMLDVVVPFILMDDPCFVLKKELMSLPFFGWFAWKTKMIPVDREAHAKALKAMVEHTSARLKDGRQIMIFPEGTRTQPGAAGTYKPGVAAIYRDVDSACHLMATNSGQHWPAKGVMGFKPGTVVFEFLPPVEAGLKRGEMMKLMQDRIETASIALLQS
ncbi:1-acyl-sn-glycerol-3-phosphate acyltransferase [Brevundimonas terrae]|uniref:1-acyl-sn-glycerol-3-phosphate acyltransferase n=1 Tax=Brevundimonas terrae TaxID=363631 RepID=A0ABP3HX47_9CAUL|nr:lysophospholipid acyltransferase family protein [Brevundimonas terrae]NIJ25717.1 1-acyl-sn-glycerol-3-phosphate acyltransferase [Brevundimonas terrae]